MISEEKIKEVRKSLNRGEPEGEIRESLAREGYSKEDIDRVFEPKGYDMRSWYLFFGCLFLAGGLWLYLNTGRVIGFSFSALLFVQYYRETARLKKRAG